MNESTPQARGPSKLDQDLASENGDSDFSYTNEWVDNIPNDSVNVMDTLELSSPTFPATLPSNTSVKVSV
jgi:hypothetical protein